jgi:uncharacterized HAD superfamily protein
MNKRKPVIAVDIDEVLADFIAYFVNYHNLTYRTRMTRDKVFSFSLHEVFEVTKEDITEKMIRFSSEGHDTKITLVPGAQEGIDALLKKGYELHLVTSRPEAIQKQTEGWIANHFPGKFTNLHHAFNPNIHKDGSKKKKWEICKEIGAGILIEDFLPNALGCVENGIKVLLMDTPWNQTDHLPENIIRVKSWEEITKKL